GPPNLTRIDQAANYQVEVQSLSAESGNTPEYAEPDSELESSHQPPGRLPFARPTEQIAAEFARPASPVEESLLPNLLPAAAPYAVGVYLLGVLAMFLRLSCGVVAVRQLRRSAQPICDPQLLSLIRRQAHQIGLKVVPVVAYCERITIPAVVGVLRPMILLPAWITPGLELDELLVVVAHEMVHIRRFDVLVNILQRLLESVLFFHPLVWYVSRQLSFERENCCDDAVVKAGHPRLRYAKTLVRVAELCSTLRQPLSPTQLAIVAATGGNDSQLKSRVLRLIGEQCLRLTRADSLTLVLMVGLLAAALAGMWCHASAATEVAKEQLTARGNEASDAPQVNDVTAEQFFGAVVDTNGKPVPGAEIWLAVAAGDYDPAARGTVRELARTDEQGKFSFRLAPTIQDRPQTIKWTHEPQLLAKAAGYGCDWCPLAMFESDPVPSPMRDGVQQAVDKILGPGRFASRTLTLPSQASLIQGRLVDLEGKPLPKVAVCVESILHPDLKVLEEAFKTSSRDLANRALYAGHRPGLGIGRNEWQVIMPPVTTNENGEFSLAGLGRDQIAVVTFSGERVVADRIFIRGLEADLKHLPHIVFYPHGAQDVFVGTRFTHVLGPAVPITGTVTEYRSEKPVAGATVFVERLFRKERTNAMQLRLHASHIRAVTDEHGRYRLTGIPPGTGHVLNVIAPKSEPWLMAEQEFSLDPKQTESIVDVRVFRGIWLQGLVTDSSTGKPLVGHVDYLALRTNPNIPQKFGLNDAWQILRFPIDESGHYKVPGLPGPGVLLVRSFGQTVYPRSVGAEKVEGYNADYLPTTPIGLPLSNWNLIQPIDPPVGAPSHALDLALSAGEKVAGRVVGPGGAAVSGVEVLGTVEREPFFESLKDDAFAIHNYQPTVARNIFFRAAGNSLVAQLRLEGTPPSNLIVTLQPAVNVKGRLIETETGDEAAGYDLDCESSRHGSFRIDDVTTDENGRFEVKGLLAGNVYQMDSANQQRFSSKKNGFTIDLTNAKPGETIELGNVTEKKSK
ncbi:MAG: hypothetical protein DME65_02730, partial [Verrucomicrobia bacterium]